jgi:hypothetical protein
MTGGCQCGAVRFAVTAAPTRIGICHCRMCQKAVAGPFGVYAVVVLGAFAWTRGEPQHWASSSRAVRDFCGRCGTPLSYRVPGGETIELLTGAFDEPARLAPTYEVGREGRLAWIARVNDLPGKTTSENMGEQAAAAIISHQHPDHDT